MNAPSAAIGIEPVSLTAADGYPIAATRFHAPASPRGHIVVAGATAVSQRFYRRFAEHASRNGFTTLTLDYRGIGGSKRGSLKGFEMHLLDWGRLDLAAAVEAMASDTVPLFLVGHSFGGHAIGLLPNHRRLAGCYVFGIGAGWHGWMPLAENLRVRFLWNVLLPALARWKGFVPFSMLGMGEDLPLGAYNPWRRWCQFPHYFFDDPQYPRIEDQYLAVTTPIVAANALDDHWSLPCSRDAFMRAYRRAPVRKIDIRPEALGGSVGHMGYFRPACQPLWNAVLESFDDTAPAARTPL